jgi:hypothetical protein
MKLYVGAAFIFVGFLVSSQLTNATENTQTSGRMSVSDCADFSILSEDSSHRWTRETRSSRIYTRQLKDIMKGWKQIMGVGGGKWYNPFVEW